MFFENNANSKIKHITRFQLTLCYCSVYDVRETFNSLNMYWLSIVNNYYIFTLSKIYYFKILNILLFEHKIKKKYWSNFNSHTINKYHKIKPGVIQTWVTVPYLTPGPFRTPHSPH